MYKIRFTYAAQAHWRESWAVIGDFRQGYFVYERGYVLLA